MKKHTKGFTLLELIIALSIWMLLSMGVFFVWQHTSRTTVTLIEQQNALENARSSMDALVINIQMARGIVLETTSVNILRQITLTERNPQGQLHDYVFDFDINASPGSARHQILRFGENEFSSGIARIYMVYVPGRRINIAIHTACAEPIILLSSVDVRYKDVVVNP